MLRTLTRILLLTGMAVLLRPDAFATETASYRLEVYKANRELRVMQGNHVVRRYHVAFGRGGIGTKRRIGDNKTPDGNYRIVNFRADSRFHYFMQLDYPNLLDAWHGYRQELIDASQFRAIATAYQKGDEPPQNTALGGYIGIHGIGELNDEKLDIHSSSNWTEGCIALTNDEITELRAYVDLGTRVVIHE